MTFHVPTTRLALSVALSASLSTSATAWSLWGPTLPPAPGVVTQIEKEVALSKGESSEFEECKERFRNHIKKGNFRAYAVPAEDNGAELILYNVVSVYITDYTVDPMTCRIKTTLITEKLRDIDNNSIFAFRDVLAAVHEINQPGNYSASDAAVEIVKSIWQECKPNDWSLAKF
jgi:hypothetical protein